jgi:cysteine-rich repeat protein
MLRPTLAARLLVLSLLCLILCVCEVSAATCGDGLQEEGEQCEDGNSAAGDGCSAACQCESDPCSFTVGAQANLASIVARLRPGATLTLSSGTYKGSGICGWRLPSGAGADDSPITVRGAGAPSVVDCDNVGPVVEGVLLGVNLRLERLQFTNAFRSGSGGAVLRAEMGSRIVVADCRILAAFADHEGGAILVRGGNSSLLIHRSHFEENSAAEFG